MLEQMKDFIRSGQQDAAIDVADSLDVHLIKSNTDVNLMADLYIENGLYEKGFNCLRELYGRKKSRSVLMQLINLSVRMKNANAAEKYYSEYKEISGNDFYNYIFRYNIDKIQGKPVETLIDSLEKLKDAEYIEIWAYELAKLYHKAGLGEKCVKECNDIEIWFGDGPYVERARALRAYYKGEIHLDKVADDKKEAGEEKARKEKKAERIVESAETAAKEEHPEETISSAAKEEYTAEAGSDAVAEGYSEEAENGAAEEYPGEAENTAVEEEYPTEAVSAATEEYPEKAVAGAAEEGNSGEIENTAAGESYSSENTTTAAEEEITEKTEESLPAEGFADNDPGKAEPELQSTPVDESEDDFAEEIKDYEEETAVESAGINISSKLVEGDEALINSFLEEEESELAQMIRIEFEKEKASEQKLSLERREKGRVPEEVQKAEELKITEEAQKAEEPQTAVETKVQEETGIQEEPRVSEEIRTPEDFQTPEEIRTPEEVLISEALKTASDEEAEEEEPEGEIETVSFDFSTKAVKEIDPTSRLGQFLKNRDESFEDYFEFYAYQTEVRDQLIKSLDYLLNPQIKNICVVVTGSSEPEKNVIIRGIARLLFNSGYLEHKQIFNSEAMKLTREDLRSKIGKLIGSCFVIRDAGKMSKETAETLLEINDEFTGRTAVMLTDEKSAMSGLFRENRELNSMFPVRVRMPDFRENDIEEMAYYKLQDSGLQLAKDAQPELVNIIRGYVRSDKNPVKKVQDLLAAVIDEVETRNAKAFLSKSGDGDFKENYIVKLKDLKKFAV